MNTRKELLDHIKEQDIEVFALIAKVIEVIKSHSLWGSDDEYTFKDGEIWYRFDPDYEVSKTHENTVFITKETEDE